MKNGILVGVNTEEQIICSNIDTAGYTWIITYLQKICWLKLHIKFFKYNQNFDLNHIFIKSNQLNLRYKNRVLKIRFAEETLKWITKK